MKMVKVWKMIQTVSTVLLYALIYATIAVPSAALADLLGSGNGTIHRLTTESSYQEGCFPPCMCPIMIYQGLSGTFKLTYTGLIDGIYVYSVDDIHWFLEQDDVQIMITGSGVYHIGSPDATTVMQHRMELDLTIDNEPLEHFDSGWVFVEDMSRINIVISTNDKICWDKAIFIDALPVPVEQIKSYSLVEGSTFQRGCWDPCDCPIGPELPMTGTFNLVPLEENLFLSKYAVVGVDWRVFINPAGDTIPIKGFGFYSIQAEFASHHRLNLELIVDQEPLTHFDSSLVGGGFDFPKIDIVVSMNGIECYDTVLNLLAEPTDSRKCGGIAGIPCADPEEFCKLPQGHCCCDFFGFCTPVPTGCPDVWNPVCGCDGVTYGNECESDAGGVSIDYRGECDAICESDFDCDGDVDAVDIIPFLYDLGRSLFFSPCNADNPCKGDFDCDGDVDGDDIRVFLEDLGRSLFYNPCPPCVAGDWCVYP